MEKKKNYFIWYFIWYIFWYFIWLLRFSSAYWAGKVLGWGLVVCIELGSWRRAWWRVGKAEVEVEVNTNMVEEKLEEEEKEEDNKFDKI